VAGSGDLPSFTDNCLRVGPRLFTVAKIAHLDASPRHHATYFSRLAGSGNPSADYYKSFMVFLKGRVLQLSLQYEIHCDLLYAMNAKLGRRLLKLDPSVPRAGITVVQSIMCRTAEHIRARWERVMQRASPRHDLSILESLDFEQDVFYLTS
jgi:hypothetical protein